MVSFSLYQLWFSSVAMPASITATGFGALVPRLSLSTICDRFLLSAILPSRIVEYLITRKLFITMPVPPVWHRWVFLYSSIFCQFTTAVLSFKICWLNHTALSCRWCRIGLLPGVKDVAPTDPLQYKAAMHFHTNLSLVLLWQCYPVSSPIRNFLYPRSSFNSELRIYRTACYLGGGQFYLFPRKAYFLRHFADAQFFPGLNDIIPAARSRLALWTYFTDIAVTAWYLHQCAGMLDCAVPDAAHLSLMILFHSISARSTAVSVGSNRDCFARTCF